MNAPVQRAALGLLLFAAGPTAEALAQFDRETDLADVSLSGQTPESIIILWPTFSFRLARLMIAKYGQPADASDHQLVWRDNGPWKTTIVYRVPQKERALGRSRGRLEQSVAYAVPADRLDELARFDEEIEADAKEGRLTARSDDESDNLLALNLADEILKGRRTLKDAVDFRRKATRLRDTGKSSPYLERLLFVPAGPPPESPN